MVRAETSESTKRNKRYLKDTFTAIPSGSLLKVFEPNTYCGNRSGSSAAGEGFGTKLLEAHVKEAVEFAVTKDRYLSWLTENQ